MDSAKRTRIYLGKPLNFLLKLQPHLLWGRVVSADKGAWIQLGALPNGPHWPMHIDS